MLHRTNTAAVALPDLRLARSFAGHREVVAMRAWYADSFQPVDGAQLYWLSTPSIAGFPFNLGVETQPVSLSVASTREVPFPQDPQSPTHQRVRADFRRELHSADTDPNGEESARFVIELEEMLRVIQLYNTGGYHCDSAVPSIEPDGYLAGPDANYQDCFPHGSDYRPQDWRISISELLRIVQFYNFNIIMGQNSYHFCPESGTEDSYCPGDPE